MHKLKVLYTLKPVPTKILRQIDLIFNSYAVLSAYRSGPQNLKLKVKQKIKAKLKVKVKPSCKQY